MKIKLKTIILAIPALSKIASENLSLKTAYRLKQTVNALQNEADFFSDQRLKIFEKYGTANEDGTFTFSKDNEPKAMNELEELLNLEVEPDIDIMDVSITENIHLNINDIENLIPFIHFVEE